MDLVKNDEIGLIYLSSALAYYYPYMLVWNLPTPGLSIAFAARVRSGR